MVTRNFHCLLNNDKDPLRFKGLHIGEVGSEI